MDRMPFAVGNARLQQHTARQRQAIDGVAAEVGDVLDDAQRPVVAARRCVVRRRLEPASRMLPEVGVSKPASMRNSVVLPQPLEPSSAKISPFWMSMETWSTAR